MIATILAQKVNPTAPGIIYSIFALIAFIGLMISTQIRFKDTTDSATNEDTTNSVTTGSATFEQESSVKPAQSADVEPAVNPIV